MTASVQTACALVAAIAERVHPQAAWPMTDSLNALSRSCVPHSTVTATRPPVHENPAGTTEGGRERERGRATGPLWPAEKGRRSQIFTAPVVRLPCAMMAFFRRAI